MDTSAALTKPSRGYLICLTAVTLWSSSAIFIRHLNDAYGMPSMSLAFWRDSFVFVSIGAGLLLFAPGRIAQGKAHLSFLAKYGFLLAVYNALWTLSVALNGAAISTVLVYSSPAFTVLLERYFFHEPLQKRKAIAVAVSFMGTIFVSGAYDPLLWQGNPLGILTGLLSGLAFGVYSLLGKEASRRNIFPWVTVFFTFGFAAAVLLFITIGEALLLGRGVVLNLFWLGGSLAGWGTLIVLALGPTIGGYGLYTVSLDYLPAGVANLIATLEPTLTAALAYALLGERWDALELMGSGLILLGVITLRIGESWGRRRGPLRP